MAKPHRPSWTLWILTLLLPLFAVGCMKAGGESSAPGSYGDDGGYYDEYGYGEGGGEYEYREAEVTAAMDSPARARASARREYANHDYEEAPAPPAEPAPDAVDTGTTIVDTPKLEPQVEPEPEPVGQAANKRQIIYTATMQVSVHDVEHAIGVAEAMPERLGGWLHQRSDNQLILRIPAEKLEQAMAEIAELGVVDYRLLEALDVTAQYTDLESRIRVLEEMQAQLKAMLAQAKTVELALEIRKALDEVTMELELARTQMRELAKSIAFSTLILRFVERGPTTSVPTSNDPFTWVDELGVELTEYR
jgi:chemotaxis protein histidine kinase CheA